MEALTDALIPEAAAFLNRHLNAQVSTDTWAAAMQPPWAGQQPNHGFILLDGESAVGVLLAFYSHRLVAGREEPVCNLAAWCVLPEFRFQSLRLLRTALAQEGYSFTDFSPSGAVIPLNTRLGFKTLDLNTYLLPCLPWKSRGTDIVTSPAQIRALLTSHERQIFDDHQHAAAAHHVLVVRPEGHSYVIYRRDRRKGLPLFATILYASDRAVFTRGAAALAWRLSLHHRIAALLVEDRVADRPRLAMEWRWPRPKMFRSHTVRAAEIDNLYSEMCCVPW